MSSIGTVLFSRGRERPEPGADRPGSSDLAGGEGQVQRGKGGAQLRAFVQAEAPSDFFE